MIQRHINELIALLNNATDQSEVNRINRLINQLGDLARELEGK